MYKVVPRATHLITSEEWEGLDQSQEFRIPGERGTWYAFRSHTINTRTGDEWVNVIRVEGQYRQSGALTPAAVAKRRQQQGRWQTLTQDQKRVLKELKESA